MKYYIIIGLVVLASVLIFIIISLSLKKEVKKEEYKEDLLCIQDAQRKPNKLELRPVIPISILEEEYDKLYNKLNRKSKFNVSVKEDVVKEEIKIKKRKRDIAIKETFEELDKLKKEIDEHKKNN